MIQKEIINTFCNSENALKDFMTLKTGNKGEHMRSPVESFSTCFKLKQIFVIIYYFIDFHPR